MNKSLRKWIKNATHHFPVLQNSLRDVLHTARRIRNKTILTGVRRDTSSTPPHLLEIPLERIVYCNQKAKITGSTPFLGTVPGESIVADGDWDQVRLRLEEMPLYQSVRAYLLDGTDLRETPIYAGKANDPAQITSGSWHAVYEQSLGDKKAKIDGIYKSLTTRGYLRQAVLGSASPHDEITVRIARDGQILLENSIHRTIISKILGIETVPVVVSTRHLQWMRTRDKFLDFARNRESGLMYGKLSHPDLWDIPHAHALDDRVALIAEHLDSTGGAALDLGCDTGIFSQFLRKAGHDVWAVERDPELAEIARTMSNIEGLGVQFIVGDILDNNIVRQYQCRHYSVVLALNILHHFLKKKEHVEKLRGILRGMRMDQLFLQCHRQDEPQMQAAYMNLDPYQFAQFIVDNSCLTSFAEVGVGRDGRKMMVLRRAGA